MKPLVHIVMVRNGSEWRIYRVFSFLKDAVECREKDPVNRDIRSLYVE
jgi:hypothetical protein